MTSVFAFICGSRSYESNVLIAIICRPIVSIGVGFARLAATIASREGGRPRWMKAALHTVVQKLRTISSGERPGVGISSDIVSGVA